MSDNLTARDAMDKELLSALMDGEASLFETRRVLNHLSADTEARQRLGRYHAVRAILHDGFPEIPVKNFAERVMSGLNEEPVPRLRFLSGKAWMAYAAAAAISGIALFGWWQEGTDPTVASLANVVDGAESVDKVANASDPALNETEMSLEDRTLLNSFLVNHSEHSAPGTMPYVRLVGFSAARQ